MKAILLFLVLISVLSASAQSEHPKTDTARNRATDVYRLIPRRTRQADTTRRRTRQPVTPGSTPQNTPQVNIPTGTNIVKNINNGIGFAVNACIGNPQDQTVTLYFTFSNPNKTHQLIGLNLKKFGSPSNALDNESNAYIAGQITLGGESNTSAFKQLVKQLPTGNVLKGNITFINVLPSVSQLSLVNILAESCNSTGGGDKKSGLIEVQNVPVKWAASN